MKHICTSCRHKFVEEEMIFGPDPFLEDVYGETVIGWLCRSCHHEKCMDI